MVAEGVFFSYFTSAVFAAGAELIAAERAEKVIRALRRVTDGANRKTALIYFINYQAEKVGEMRAKRLNFIIAAFLMHTINKRCCPRRSAPEVICIYMPIKNYSPSSSSGSFSTYTRSTR